MERNMAGGQREAIGIHLGSACGSWNVHVFDACVWDGKGRNGSKSHSHKSRQRGVARCVTALRLIVDDSAAHRPRRTLLLVKRKVKRSDRNTEFVLLNVLWRIRKRGNGRKSKSYRAGGWIESKAKEDVTSPSNLIELVARVLLEPADVSHCEPVPLVRPAEQLPVEVREQSALLLHSQMHTKCRVYE